MSYVFNDTLVVNMYGALLFPLSNFTPKPTGIYGASRLCSSAVKLYIILTMYGALTNEFSAERETIEVEGEEELIVRPEKERNVVQGQVVEGRFGW